MTPEAKIWLILKNLNDALAITPSETLSLLNAKELEKLINREDHEQILGKLVKDYKVIDIKEKPNYKKQFFYKFKLTDRDKYEKILKDAHTNYFGSIGMLTGDNFLSVVDVSADIMNGLQMVKEEEIIIQLLPTICRFSNLMPADSVNLRDRYCDLRFKAIGYLKDNGHIESFKLLKQDYGNFHRWDFEVKISLNRIRFTKFYEQLVKTYDRRIKFRSEEQEIKKEDEALDYTNTASRRAWGKKWETLQIIWTIYESNNKNNQLLVPIKKLTIKSRAAFEIDGILAGFKNECCFNWHRGTKNYEIKNINHNQLAETYKKTELIYGKFAKIYQERTGNKNISDSQRTIQEVKITGMPELKIKGFEEKVILQKPKNKRIQLRNFPKDLKWEEITMRFLNDHEVILEVQESTYQTNYEEMGFQDETKKLPNKQWKFLNLLAIKNGEVSWENNKDLSLKRINSIKKQKQLLTEALKAYFQIKDEPFLDYKKEKAYKIKINLIPETNSTTSLKEKRSYKNDKDDLGIEEYRKEQSPEVYEK